MGNWFAFFIFQNKVFLNNPTPPPTHPPGGIIILCQNQLWSSSNFQCSFFQNYQHDIGCQRWLHPPSLQSGTLNVLQVPNETSQLTHDGSSSNFQDIFLIIYQHDLWSFMSPVKNPQYPPSPKWSQSAKSWLIFIKLSGYLPDPSTNIIYDLKDDPILQASSQEPSTLSKKPMQ